MAQDRVPRFVEACTINDFVENSKDTAINKYCTVNFSPINKLIPF